MFAIASETATCTIAMFWVSVGVPTFAVAVARNAIAFHSRTTLSPSAARAVSGADKANTATLISAPVNRKVVMYISFVY